MKKISYIKIAVALGFIATSCNTDFDTDLSENTATNGEADFTTYVALGNSLTSGYRDNALYLDGQNESYPMLIAQQMQRAGGGDFLQPLMPDNIGGFTDFSVAGKLVLQNVGGSLSPVPSTAINSFSALPSKKYQNLGVPGAKSFHLIAPNYGNLAGGNPYFARFASSTTTTVLEDAKAQNPTFFSLWIGNNDILGYASSGGIGVNQTGNNNLANYGSYDISDPDVVKNAIEAIVSSLTTGGAKGVIANIPSVTSIPFFTTIPHNPVALDQTKVTQLNALVQPVKNVLSALGEGSRLSLLVVGNNPLLIHDETLTDYSAQIKGALEDAGISETEATKIGNAFGQARHATQSDLILLTTKAVIGTQHSDGNIFGISTPLLDQHVLTKDEVSQITIATNAYNTEIKNIANTYNLAFVDAAAKMQELNSSSGIIFDGVKYTTSFISGGAFSLDGVHLTGRGYAVIANEFIKAINQKYKSTLPLVNPNNYSGIKFP